MILHFYNSTSTLQRKVVFHMDMPGITKIATDAAKLIYDLSQSVIAEGIDLRYEYSPESFMGTEMDYAVEICRGRSGGAPRHAGEEGHPQPPHHGGKLHAQLLCR